MAFSEYIYLLISIAYFVIALIYIPAFVLSMTGGQTKDSTDPQKMYGKVRYGIFIFMYMIIGGLYLYEWKEHFGNTSH